MKKISKYVMVFLFALTVSFFVGEKQGLAAETQYISELSLASGSDAQTKLEDAGYTVLPQCLNMQGIDKKKAVALADEAYVYLGYKLTTDKEQAIRNIILSSKDSLSGYDKVSKTSVNEGVSGEKLYLYTTKDKKAGEAVIMLDFAKSDNLTNAEKQVDALRNDGMEPIRGTDGKIADFEMGRSGLTMYIYMLRDDVFNPYISDMTVVVADNRKSALLQAVKEGYNYFVDYDANKTTSNYELIAYNRSAKVTDAITKLYRSDSNAATMKVDGVKYNLVSDKKLSYKGDTFYLYSTKKKSADNPILALVSDIDKKIKSLDIKECAAYIFGSSDTISYIYRVDNADYNDFLTNKMKYKMDVDNFGMAVLRSSGEVAADDEPEVTPVPTLEPSEEPQEVKPVSQQAVSGSGQTGKDTDKNKQDDTTASVFMDYMGVWWLVGILLIGVAVFFYLRYRKKKGEQ